MKVINAELVPIMIATEGNDFFDRNHTEKAADHIVNIIASHELGGSRRTHYLRHYVVERSK